MSRAVTAAPASALSGVDMLLALQAAEDPLHRRRKAVRRGQNMLATLEEMQADLLVGGISQGRLNQLQLLVMQVREKTLPHLDAVIDDIELRVQVELAKHGRM